MKLPLLAGLTLMCQVCSASAGPEAINAVLGDVSFAERFAALPDDTTPDLLRIVIHLEYVETLLLNKGRTVEKHPKAPSL
jgi:hypothetical protein